MAPFKKLAMTTASPTVYLTYVIPIISEFEGLGILATGSAIRKALEVRVGTKLGPGFLLGLNAALELLFQDGRVGKKGKAFTKGKKHRHVDAAKISKVLKLKKQQAKSQAALKANAASTTGSKIGNSVSKAVAAKPVAVNKPTTRAASARKATRPKRT